MVDLSGLNFSMLRKELDELINEYKFGSRNLYENLRSQDDIITLLNALKIAYDEEITSKTKKKNRKILLRKNIIARLEREVVGLSDLASCTKELSLPWTILPAGNGLDLLNQYFDQVELRKPNLKIDRSRLEFAYSLSPEKVYTGKGNFDGYIVLTFQHTQKVLLECPVYGNAIYIINDNWRTLSQESKSSLLELPRGIKRIVHSTNWRAKVKSNLKL